MTKSIKIFYGLIIIFAFLLNIYGNVYASDVNMNLTEDTNTNSVDANVYDDTEDSLPLDDFLSTDVEGESLESTDVSAIEEEGLSFSNVLSILLIAVGLILILLAIAIITRLK